MTTTTVISAVTFGTSTTGPYQSATKTALQATTSCVKIACKVTRGSANIQQGSSVIVRHAVSPNEYSSALLGAQALRAGAEYVDIPLYQRGDGSLDIELASDLLVTAAGFHYVWFDAPTLTEAATLTVSLEELP